MRLTTSVVATTAASLALLQSATAQYQDPSQTSLQSQGESSQGGWNGQSQTNGNGAQSPLQGGGSQSSTQQTDALAGTQVQNGAGQDAQSRSDSSQDASQQAGPAQAGSPQGNPQGAGAPPQQGHLNTQQTSPPPAGAPAPNPPQSNPPPPAVPPPRPQEHDHKKKSEEKKSSKSFLPGLRSLGVGAPKKQEAMRDNTLFGIPVGDRAPGAKKKKIGNNKKAILDPNASLTEALNALFKNFDKNPDTFKKNMKRAFEVRAPKDPLEAKHFKQKYTMVGKDKAKEGKKGDKKPESKDRKGPKRRRSIVARGLLNGFLGEEDPHFLDARDAIASHLWARSASAEPYAEAHPDAEPDPEAYADAEADAFAEPDPDAWADADPYADPEAAAESSPDPEADPGAEPFPSPYAYANGIADSFASTFEYESLDRRDLMRARTQFIKRELLKLYIEKRVATAGEEGKKKEQDEDGEKSDSGDKPAESDEGDEDKHDSKKPTSKGKSEDEHAGKKERADSDKKEGDGASKLKAADEGGQKPQKYKDTCDACSKMGIPGSLCKVVKICQ